MSSLKSWEEIARKRILSILEKRRISYSSHLEIKIAEAGPNYMRAEPHTINRATRSLLKDKLISVYSFNTGNGADPIKFYIPNNFGSAADISRAKYFNE